jgi:hypothetical protein
LVHRVGVCKGWQPSGATPAAAQVSERLHPAHLAMKSRKRFLLRINPALYEALEAWAQQDLRSVNGQIEYLLTQAVARRGRPLPKQPQGPAEDAEELPGEPHPPG